MSEQVKSGRSKRAFEKCPICGGSNKETKDALSARERDISGLCQVCQDRIFDADLLMDFGPALKPVQNRASRASEAPPPPGGEAPEGPKSPLTRE